MRNAMEVGDTTIPMWGRKYDPTVYEPPTDPDPDGGRWGGPLINH